MSRIISEFSVRDINSIEDYERFFHTKNYLRSKTIPTDGDFKLSRAVMTESKDMMTALGFSNLEKFIRLKGEWDSLRQDVPLAYLDYIGADRKTLSFARKYATPCEGGEDIGVSRIC